MCPGALCVANESTIKRERQLNHELNSEPDDDDDDDDGNVGDEHARSRVCVEQLGNNVLCFPVELLQFE